MGPWRHSRRELRRHVARPARVGTATPRCSSGATCCKPFFDQYLKDGAPKADTPPVFIYNTGENHWDRLTTLAARVRARLRDGIEAALSRRRLRPVVRRPAGCSAPAQLRRVRLRSGRSRCRTCRGRCASPMRDAWRKWLRAAISASSPIAPTCSTYQTPAADRAAAASAARRSCNLFASTSGTDSDWVVKLIDVYPDEVPSQPEMGGYQLGDRDGHLPRPLSRELRAPDGDPAEHAAAVPVRAADGEPRLPARPPHHGAGAVDAGSRSTTATRRRSCRTSSSRSRSDYVKATQRVYHAAATSTYPS